MLVSELIRRFKLEPASPLARDFEIRGVQPLGRAGAGDLSFLTNPKYKGEALATNKLDNIADSFDEFRFRQKKYNVIRVFDQLRFGTITPQWCLVLEMSVPPPIWLGLSDPSCIFDFLRFGVHVPGVREYAQ